MRQRMTSPGSGGLYVGVATRQPSDCGGDGDLAFGRPDAGSDELTAGQEFCGTVAGTARRRRRSDGVENHPTTGSAAVTLQVDSDDRRRRGLVRYSVSRSGDDFPTIPRTQSTAKHLQYSDATSLSPNKHCTVMGDRPETETISKQNVTVAVFPSDCAPGHGHGRRRDRTRQPTDHRWYVTRPTTRRGSPGRRKVLPSPTAVSLNACVISRVPLTHATDAQGNTCPHLDTATCLGTTTHLDTATHLVNTHRLARTRDRHSYTQGKLSSQYN
ncbi:hypothetical protein Bbelb_362990 [Branchiostoma belcheri]|nr:hypothetical protein Bbelb_362990 [Branchiostoma belcheri]